MNKPNSKKFEVKSFGCSANFSEGEGLAGQLNAKGYSENKDEDGNDLLVLNVCTVKGDEGALKEVRNALTENPDRKILLSGCVTPELVVEAQKLNEGISAISTHGINKVEKVAEQTLEGKAFVELKKDKKAPTPMRVQIPKSRSHPTIGIITVCTGCLDRCAFCSTVAIKGKLESYPLETLVQETQDLVNDGCKEIWLTGQDAACYGFDIGTNMAKLLVEMCKIEGDFFIRIGMGNPRHLKGYMPELIEALKHSKVFKFIHLPVQAGDNEVLKMMKRRHTVEDYTELVSQIREEIPDFTLSTDIIVGHPGEDDAAFQKTMDLLDQTRPSVCNRTRFVPRPNTLAATYKDISGKIKKERSTLLTARFKEIAKEESAKWLGRTTRVVINEAGRTLGTKIGRNEFYRQVEVEGNYVPGTILKVKITSTAIFGLAGEVLEVL